MPVNRFKQSGTVDELMKELIEERVGPDGKFKWETPEKIKSMIMVYAAQGVIDNGGFQYFFSSDFPDARPRDFIQAYKTLELNEHASKLEYILNLFPDGIPQQDLKIRKSFLQERFTDEHSDVSEIESFFFQESENVYNLVWSLARDLDGE